MQELGRCATNTEQFVDLSPHIISLYHSFPSATLCLLLYTFIVCINIALYCINRDYNAC
jgi:hypothetical protein